MADKTPRDARSLPDDELQWDAEPQHRTAGSDRPVDDDLGAGDISPPASTQSAEPSGRPQGMVPGRAHRRTKVERGLMRLVATAGIVGIAVALGAILVSQDVAGWIVGLVIGLVTVVLAALLWSSREL